MRISSQSNSPTFPTVDYLLIGHLSEDRTPEGIALGGTVCYSGLTAHAMGHTVGVITAASQDLDLRPLEELYVMAKASPRSTSIENTYTLEGRVQKVHSQAVNLDPDDIPSNWKGAALVHFAPLVGEFSIAMLRAFEDSFIGLTPQGLMREWDSEGRVSSISWEVASDFVRAADAVVVSTADLGMDDEAADAMAAECTVMVLTDGPGFARVWSEGQVRSIPAPTTHEVDSTGAGDIFAAAFFSRFQQSGDPWMSTEIAVRMATASVKRSGLAGVPSSIEVQNALARESD